MEKKFRRHNHDVSHSESNKKIVLTTLVYYYLNRK